jgi:DNA-directed RNA polymerase alpha subunit
LKSNRSNCRSCRKYQKLYEAPIGELEIPDYLVRRLRRNGILTIGQLSSLTQEDLNRFYWVGKGSIEQIQNALAALGLKRIPR